MASTFDNDLRLEEMATGENAGSWGTKTNTNLELIADAFGYGTFTIADADTTLTMPDGSDTDNALRSLYLKISSSADLTTTRTLTLAPNTVSKLWYIENNTSGGQTITISQGSGANVNILNGQAKLIATDGSGAGAAVIDATQDLAIPDLFIDDDLSLQSDGAVINFGEDADVNLTHVADTGLRLNDAMALEFRDGDLSINSSADGQLDINADSAVAFDTDTLYVDTANDRVGVNVAAPSRAFEVNSGTNDTTIVATSTDAGAFIAFEDSATTGDTSVRIGAIGNELRFDTDNGERVRIDTSGRVIIGRDEVLSIDAASPRLQVLGTTKNDSAISTARFSNSSGPSHLIFGKSRATNYGSNTIVQNNDTIGYIVWNADDGTDLATAAAAIDAQVDGTPGANDMPGRLVFRTTADGNASPSERMRINSSGHVTIGSGGSQTNNLTVYDASADSAITIQSADGSTAGLVFGDATDFSRGRIVYDNSDESMAFETNNLSEAMRIDSSQRVLIGTTSAYTSFFNNDVDPQFQVVGADSGASSVAVVRTSNDGDGPSYLFGRMRSTSHGIVQNGDRIGRLTYQAADGVALQQSASIDAYVDGTPGVNDTPARIVFSTTADGANTYTERMRITNGGRVGINTASESGAPLGWLTIDNDINSADVLTNKASYHIVVGVDGGHTDNYIGGIGFGDVVRSDIQAAISAVDNGTSAATGIAFATGNTSSVLEAMRINSGQRVLVGQKDARNSFFNNNVGTYNPRFQIESSNTTGGIRMASFVHNDDANNAFCLVLGKSGGTTAGSLSTIVQNHTFGLLSFQGATGNALAEGARIQGVSDGAPGSSDMPGRIEFKVTPDGSSSSAEKMRLNSSGFLSVGGSFSASDPLHVRKSSGTTIARFEHTGGDGNIVVEDSSGAEATMGIGGSGDDSYWGNGNQKGLWHYAAGSATGNPSDAHAQMMIDRTMRVGSAPGTSSRSETLVFHLWEARNLDNVAGTALQGGQTDTVGGTSMYRPSTASSNTMYFGPYGAFPAGSYTALHRMKVTDNTPTGNLILLNVSGAGMAGARGAGSYNQGTSSVQLSATDFDDSNKYQYFAVDFEKDNNDANVEFRGLNFQTGKTNVYLDHILVVPRVNF